MTSVRVLVELVIVLGSAAIVTVGFQALRLPVALGYVLAGLVIGPHVPVPLVADVALVHVLSELGVIFLMFTIGLELPLATIMRHGLPAALTALFEVGLVVALGTLVARLVGLPPTLGIIMGACLGISSTMLVAKAFDELGWKGGFTDLVFAILVFEDVIAIVLLAIVTALASGAGLDATHLLHLLGKLGGFLALLLVGGLLVVPRVIRWMAERARRETLVITSLLICFGAAAFAAYAGFSVALGAFIAGVLIAESGHGETVALRVETLRDVFTMIFFVSIGMSIDPAALWTEAPRILVLAVVVLVTKPLGVATGSFLAGNGVSRSLRTGLSLAQIGEFSFVIAGVSGSPQLLAIAVGVSCVTTLVSPLLIRSSERIAGSLAHRLPGGVATFVSFYESWLASLRARAPSAWPRYRRTVLILGFDACMVGAIVIIGSSQPWLLLAAAPFAIDSVRRAAVLARRLAHDAVPEGGAVDLGRASRAALVLMFELAIALAIIVPIVAIVQPFVPASFAVVLVIALGLVLVMRRRIADFEGHVRASSELILELLATQPGDAALAQVSTVLPGFANTQSVALVADAPAIGRSLAELDLRAKTGATVLAIARGASGVATPSPNEPLRSGDVLALAGSDEAIAAARLLLLSSPGAT
jgi:CPA2 family monovalent cation:H+ antiporter-2